MSEFNKDHDRISAFTWDESSIRVYGNGEGKARLEARRNEKRMKNNEIKDELNELIVEFANKHGLFSLKIEYDGYHECDYDLYLKDTDCSFVTETMEISIG